MGQLGWNPVDRILAIGIGKGDAGVNFRPLTVQTGFLGGQRPVAHGNANVDAL